MHKIVEIVVAYPVTSVLAWLLAGALAALLVGITSGINKKFDEQQESF